MDIYYKSRKMEKLCSDEREMKKQLGQQNAKKLQQRLMEIRSANVLSDLTYLPGPRLHKLEGKRDNHLAVDVKQPFRLIFEPYHDPVPLKQDGGFDWTQITSILIIEVVDYHD